MSRPQTIQIFLSAGDPRGMRVVEITTRIVRVIEVPRSQLVEFLKMPEAQQVGVYFLMGELLQAGLPRVYIGQSGSVGTRLVQHNQNQDFWKRALGSGRALQLDERQYRRCPKRPRRWKQTAVQKSGNSSVNQKTLRQFS